MNKSGIRISIPKELQEFCDIKYWYDNARRDYILEFVCGDRDMSTFPKFKEGVIEEVYLNYLMKMYKEKLKKEKRRNNENKKR